MIISQIIFYIGLTKIADAIETKTGDGLVVVGKGNRQRIVPLEPRLAKTIRERRGWCFPGRFCGHVEASYVGKHLARLLKPYTAHSLRHRYATTAWCATHGLLLVSKLLGHASVETTERYVAMPDARLRVVLPAVGI